MFQQGTLLLLASVASLVNGQSKISFGSAFSLGATNSYIIDAVTTMYPGTPPSPQKARLALWPGMGTDTGNLVQAIVLSSTDAESTNCGGKTRVEGQWCVFASVLQDGTQVDGTTVPMSAGQGVTIHYKYDESSGNTVQTVSIGGTTVSQLSTKSGKAIGWGTAVECQDNACSGKVAAHTYQNTTITLAKADTGFKNTLVLTNASGDLKTTDNKVFTVSKITIGESDFTNV